MVDGFMILGGLVIYFIISIILIHFGVTFTGRQSEIFSINALPGIFPQLSHFPGVRLIQSCMT